MGDNERCERVGGELIDNSCIINDFNKAVEVVTDCMAYLKDKTPLSKPVNAYDSKQKCITSNFSKLKVSEDDINKVDEEVERWVMDSEYTPDATIIHNTGEKEVITDYSRPAHIDAKWKPIGHWRGHYDLVTDDEWKRLHTDCILSMSEDSMNLKEFDDKLKEYLDKEDVEYATVYTRTSNVFSSGYDLIVKSEDAKGVGFLKAIKKATSLSNKYRDPETFAITAITGKTSPKEFTEQDKKLVCAVRMLDEGKDIEEIKKKMVGN